MVCVVLNSYLNKGEMTRDGVESDGSHDLRLDGQDISTKETRERRQRMI